MTLHIGMTKPSEQKTLKNNDLPCGKAGFVKRLEQPKTKRKGRRLDIRSEATKWNSTACQTDFRFWEAITHTHTQYAR